MAWKTQEDLSISDRDADLTLRYPRGPWGEDFRHSVIKISDGKWVFSFEFNLISEQIISDEMKKSNPDHDYVTRYSVVKSDLTDDQLNIVRNILYAKTNNKENGFSFKRDGEWVKSIVEILFIDRIEGMH